MDLISREEVLEYLDKRRTYELMDGRNKAYGKGIRDTIKDIEAQPSVPAVPLDKLCEWLAERYEPPYALIDIDKLRIPIDFRQQKEIWMAALTKWMEETNATDTE
jgi:hypothetical protein